MIGANIFNSIKIISILITNALNEFLHIEGYLRRNILIPTTSKKLYIIGNGFDLAHGVKSSYYEFKNYLMKHQRALCEELDMYFECKDFWGDFENNLAFLSREMVMESVDAMLDMYLETDDEDDQNFSYANYFAAIDIGTQIVPDVIERLPKYFARWIRTLKLTNDKNIIYDQMFDEKSIFINFNYTEFLETLYGIQKQRILYIHGDRRNRNEPLIIGHGRDTEADFINWYEQKKEEKQFQPSINAATDRDENDNLSYLTYFLEDDENGNWRSPMRYYAADKASEVVGDYFSETEKQTAHIIQRHQWFFDVLGDISEIIVIGHSLSPVDHPYFKKIIQSNHNVENLCWHFSWYSDDDKNRILDFCNIMGIHEQNVELFQV